MDKKLELIRYILSRLDGGVADLWKIYKLMYFIDFAFYAEHKKSLSGAEYYNWQYGPVPMNQQQYLIENLIESGEGLGLWRKVDQKSVQVNNPVVDKDGFNSEEVAVIDGVLSKYGGLTGRELVTLSHEDIPWKMTKEGEKIEYDYVFWRETEPVEIQDITDQVLK